MPNLKDLRTQQRRENRVIQEFMSNKELFQRAQTAVANVTKYLKQNPGKKIFMAKAFETLALDHILMKEKIDAYTLAKTFTDLGCVIFIDDQGNPIDGSKVTILEVKKTIQEVAPKKGDGISKRDLKRTLEKTLHELKGANPLLVDGINKYHQALINNLDNLK